MATLASLLIAVGVRLDGALKVEGKIRRMRRDARKLGEAGEQGTSRFRRGMRRLKLAVETE